MSSGEWAPLAAAVAGLLVAATPAIVSLIVAIGNRERLEVIGKATNGTLTALRAEVAELKGNVTALNAALVESARKERSP